MVIVAGILNSSTDYPGINGTSTMALLVGDDAHIGAGCNRRVIQGYTSSSDIGNRISEQAI